MARRKLSGRNFWSPEYIAWRKAVYDRDHNRCQFPECGRRGKLNAHHIIPWARSHDLRFCLSNGITLCYDHHKMITGRESEYVQLFQAIVRANSMDQKSADPFGIEKLLEEKRKEREGR